jgi:RND superfamily putative drug exporter
MGGVTVISPWGAGPRLAQLPDGAASGGPSRAVILLDFHIPLAEAIRDAVPELEATLEATAHPPVEATQSGFASVSRALQHESLSAAERAELLATPLLLVVLLLVFRSVLAALIPLAIGAMTLLAGRGVLVLLTGFMPIDALSLVVCTMMGLALGVDYSLLIVTRFREELDAGRSAAIAASVTRATAGRTAAIAGSTLFFSIFLSAFFQPGTLLVSLATALAVVTAIAVAIAWAALPAALTLLGPRINAGRIGSSSPRSGSRIASAAATALRRPALATVLIAVPLLLLSAPALAFDTGSPGIDELSPSSQARKNSEAIADSVGAGWQAPYIFTLSTEPGPITSQSRLALLDTTQRRIGDLAGVRAVIGPSQLVAAARPLRSLVTEMDPRRGKAGGELDGLGPKLSAASGAVQEIRGGLQEASAAGGLLEEGSARGGTGAELLAAGLKEAGEGSERARRALERFATGSDRLAEGQRQASGSAYGLSRGLATLLPTVTGQGLDRARRLSSRLGRAARADPAAAAAAREAAVLVSVLSSAREELARLRAQARALKRGLGRLGAGGGRLSAGSAELATGAGGLRGGIRSLQAGAERLAGGLRELEGGAATLSQRLALGSQRAYPLQQGLARAGRRVAETADPLERHLRRLDRLSPDLLDSGYVEAAALAGAGKIRGSLAAEVINVPAGADAARYLVVPEAGFNDPSSRRLGARLQSLARDLDGRGGLQAGVSGGAAVLNDYGTATKARLPLVVIAIVAITFMMLLALLRAPLLVALAVGLNLLTVAAAIGVVTLSCQIPAGYPLGGHPYIDTVGAGAIFGVTFGLSIDYAVFLLARMRERYRAVGDNEAAIRFGLQKTAGVITGAAAIMAAVFVSFAIAPVATVSQMGLGLTVAILLDATIVRILLLPALMLLIGDRVWWTPPWLDRLLPGASPFKPTSEGVS